MITYFGGFIVDRRYMGILLRTWLIRIALPPDDSNLFPFQTFNVFWISFDELKKMCLLLLACRVGHSKHIMGEFPLRKLVVLFTS